MDCSPPGSSVHGIFQARILEWVDTSFSRGIFLSQGSNPHLLHWQVDSLTLSHQGSPYGLVCTKLLSHVQISVIPWTLACQAPPSMGFPRKEYWLGCHFLLQRIFPTQRSNLGLLYCRQTLYCLSHQGSPIYFLDQGSNLGSLRWVCRVLAIEREVPFPDRSFS